MHRDNHTQIDAQFKNRQSAIDTLCDSVRNIAPQIGWTAEKERTLTGLIERAK